MLNNCFGFIGSDKYDIILCFARCISKLGKKVLVLDLSETKAISYSIPNPEHLCTVDFRDVTYSSESELFYSKSSNFDYILIDFGLGKDTELLKFCDNIVFVTDQKVHHLTPLCENYASYLSGLDGDSTQEGTSSQKLFLVARDFVGAGFKTRHIMKKLGVKVPADRVFTMMYDDTQYAISLRVQYENNFRFKGSLDLQEICRELIGDACTDKEFRKAYKKAEGGK